MPDRHFSLNSRRYQYNIRNASANIPNLQSIELRYNAWQQITFKKGGTDGLETYSTVVLVYRYSSQYTVSTCERCDDDDANNPGNANDATRCKNLSKNDTAAAAAAPPPRAPRPAEKQQKQTFIHKLIKVHDVRTAINTQHSRSEG